MQRKIQILTLATVVSFLLSGCGGGSSGETASATTIQVVRGPILHADVRDNNNHVGVEEGDGKYTFSQPVNYPVVASGGVIDVNRNGIVDAGDVSNDMKLTATSGEVITVVTTLEANASTKGLVEQAAQDLNISLNDLYTKTPLDSLAIEAMSNILYKHVQDNNISESSAIQTAILTEYEKYENDTNHDSQATEEDLMNQLVAENKVHELNTTEADVENEQYNNETSEQEDGTSADNDTNDGESNTNTTTGGGAITSGGTTGTNTGAYTLLAWNDLGMHCMDGSDFSVFSILPPYNNLNAQLIKKSGTSNKHITSGVILSYESFQSLNGKFNTTSLLDSNNNPKTNFWDYVTQLFNTTPAPNIGLTGNKAPSLVPQPLTYNATHDWFEATGIPLTPYNDDGSKNYYPLVKVTAKDTSGAVLATTTVVLPVSDEMDCKVCHSSTSGVTAAKPTAGWENDSNSEKDFKYNILRLHDQKFPTAVSDNQTALNNAGYKNYSDVGLYASAKNGNPVLCATCHKSNALPGTGIAGIKPLTEAIHSLHADVTDPTNGSTLSASSNRSACYRCHPGATTKCLRGAMGKQSNIQCQSCHGNMNAVGKHGREGWLDEPNCQACHQAGNRYATAVTSLSTGTLRASLDTRFSTNPNMPVSGKSMYRFSTGHGKMQCSACHGSTHAIYPSSHEEDNLQSIAVQGHAGTVAECTACHTTAPITTDKGPHGMHTVGQDWINNHQHVAEANPTQCTACHGTDYRGSVLSKTFSARTFTVENSTKAFAAGHKISCYDCHNGPNPD